VIDPHKTLLRDVVSCHQFRKTGQSLLGDANRLLGSAVQFALYLAHLQRSVDLFAGVLRNGAMIDHNLNLKLNN
jgi:hypothetical protein